MATDVPDYEPLVREAVAAFWGIRDRQATEQALRGVQDAGTRGAVTGGLHLGPVEALVRRVLTDAGVADADIHTGRSATLPGWFRELKNWDVVVLEGDTLVAAIELKSQVGSFGKNLNNRVEEAIGQSVDFWHAVEKGLMGGLRPWFGYMMVVEESEESTRAVRSRRGLVPADPVFTDASYTQRYVTAFSRLHQERLLDAVAFAISPRDTNEVTYPSPAMSFQPRRGPPQPRPGDSFHPMTESRFGGRRAPRQGASAGLRCRTHDRQHRAIADFSQAVVLMTSNLGADAFSKPELGFTSAEAERTPRERIVETVRDTCPPELFGLLDDVAIEPTDEVIRFLAETGHDPATGARHVQRNIERLLLQGIVGLDPGSWTTRLADDEIEFVPG